MTQKFPEHYLPWNTYSHQTGVFVSMSSSESPSGEAGAAINRSDDPSPQSFSLALLWLLIADKNATPSPTPDSPIMILGRSYTDGLEVEKGVYSRIWLTYRTGFEPIPRAADGPLPLSFVPSMIFNRNPISSAIGNIHGFVDNDTFTTDCGWGCMIRTSQLLLANALQTLLFGRDYVYDPESPNVHTHNELVDLFQDKLDSPFSLHNFVRVAQELPLQVKPGEWFGPSAASLSIKRLCDKLQKGADTTTSATLPKLKVLISESCDLYDNDIAHQLDLLEARDSLLVLFPIRLGIDRTNAFYHPSLLQLLSLKQLVGIAGGKPSSSFYFFGHQGNDLLYLDPHYPQHSADYETFHTKRILKLDVAALDPSMLVGVLINDQQDYEDFRNLVTEGKNKIIHFHPASSGGRLRSVPGELGRKSSDFVNIQPSDANEDFVHVKGSFSAKDDEDFVCVGDDLTDNDGLLKYGVESIDEQIAGDHGV